MKWSKIVNIHKTIKKLPDHRALLESLYPEAFEEHVVTKEIRLEPDFHSSCGSNSFHIKMTLKRKQVYDVATIQISKKSESVSGFTHGAPEKRRAEISYPLKMKVAYGFKVEILPINQDGGFRVCQYGYIDEEKAPKAVKK